MTNDEMRIAIAKAKGINAGVVKEWDDIYGGHHTHDYGGDREWYPAGTPVYYAENGVFYPLPNWPESIADAMELWEDMKRFVTIWYDEVQEVWVVYDKKRDSYNDAKLLPEAICQVWLNQGWSA